MVKRNIRNDRHQGTDDIGGIQPSAEPHLNDGNIDLPVGKILECHGDSHFEERRMEFGEHCLIVLNEINDILFVNHFTVDFDSFPEILQVGRCI